MLAPQFEMDVYISYSHLDDLPLVTGEQGWVTKFHEALSNALSMRLGRRVRIWRDTKLSGNDSFATELGAQFPKIAILISVLSPCYVQSEWCRKEVAEFCKAADQSGGVVVDSKPRIIKVIKCPIKSEDPLPSIMKETLGYEFYVYKDERPIELDDRRGPDLAQRYAQKIMTLAYDIANLLEELEDRSRRSESVEEQERRGVDEQARKPEVERLCHAAGQVGAEEERRLADQKLKEEEKRRTAEEEARQQEALAAQASERKASPSQAPDDLLGAPVIFICYGHEDRSFAVQLAAQLRGKGVRVWLDRDIRMGQNYRRAINDALRSCDRMLVILSPASAESPEVEAEWESVLKRKKEVIPVLYKPCDIPYRLGTLEFVDFTENPDQALDELISSLTDA